MAPTRRHLHCTLFAPEAPLVFSECHFLDTGYCLALESTLLRGGTWRLTHCHCLAALLKHPTEGWGLWDTGYAPRMWEETRRFPYRVYRWGTPLPKQTDRSILTQLEGKGLAAQNIRWILLSHLHGDHVAGLRDFPEARLYVSLAAYEFAARQKGFTAVRQGYIPALLPEDFASRARFISAFEGPEMEGLGPSYDLFGDGAALLFPLRGHARGQMGMLAETEQGSFLLVADSALHRESIRSGRPPGIMTRIIEDEPDQVLPTIQRLRAFTQAHPNVAVVPTHCPEAYREILSEKESVCLPSME